MSRQYLDKEGLQIIAEKIKEAKEIANEGVSVGSAALVKIDESKITLAIDSTLRPKLQFYGVTESTGTGAFRRLKLTDDISILICPNVGTTTGVTAAGQCRCTFFFPKINGKKYDLISFSARQSLNSNGYLCYNEFIEKQDDWRVDFYVNDVAVNDGIYCSATLIEYNA